MKISPLSILGRLLAVVLSTAITVGVFEITFRLTHYLPEYTFELPPLGEKGKLDIVLDPDLLFRFKPNSLAGINAAGFRGAGWPAGPLLPPPVVLLGDSFVMGNNLAIEDTLPNIIQTKLDHGISVLNFGMAGYGPDQELKLLEQSGLELKPAVVVLMIFAGNDFRDLAFNEMFQIGATGQLEEEHPNVIERILPTLRTEMLLRMVFTHRYLPAEIESNLAHTLVQDKTEILSSLTPAERSRRTDLMTGVIRLFVESAERNHFKLLVGVIPSWEAVGGDPNLAALEDSMRFVNEDAAIQACQHAQSVGGSHIPVECLNLTTTILAKGGIDLYDPAYRHLNIKGASDVAEALLQPLSRLLG